MALMGRSSTVLRVGILLSSSGTHSIGPMSDITGRSELGSVDIGDGDGGGVASFVDVVGGAYDGVHVFGVLSEIVCPVFFFLFLAKGTGTGLG